MKSLNHQLTSPTWQRIIQHLPDANAQSAGTSSSSSHSPSFRLLDPHVLHWLQSMGYAVTEMRPRQLLVVLQGEARKWGFSAQALVDRIREHRVRAHKGIRR